MSTAATPAVAWKGVRAHGGELYVVDEYEFDSVPKLGPSLIFDRVLPESITAEVAARQLFRARHVTRRSAPPKSHRDFWSLVKNGGGARSVQYLVKVSEEERAEFRRRLAELTDAGLDSSSIWLGWLAAQGPEVYAARSGEPVPDTNEGWSPEVGEQVVVLADEVDAVLASAAAEAAERDRAWIAHSGILQEHLDRDARYHGLTDWRADDWYNADVLGQWFSCRALVQRSAELRECVVLANIPPHADAQPVFIDFLQTQFAVESTGILAMQMHDPRTSLSAEWTPVLEIPTRRTGTADDIARSLLYEPDRLIPID